MCMCLYLPYTVPFQDVLAASMSQTSADGLQNMLQHYHWSSGIEVFMVFGIKHYHEVRALAATVHAFHPTILTSGCGLPRKGTTFQPIIFPNPISYSRLKYFRENSWTSNSWSLSQLLAYSMRYSAKVSCISPPSRKTFGHPLVSRKPGGHFANEDSESNTRELYLRYLMIHSHTVALHLIRYLWYFCIGRHKLIQKTSRNWKKSLDHKILKAPGLFWRFPMSFSGRPTLAMPYFPCLRSTARPKNGSTFRWGTSILHVAFSAHHWTAASSAARMEDRPTIKRLQARMTRHDYAMVTKNTQEPPHISKCAASAFKFSN